MRETQTRKLRNTLLHRIISELSGGSAHVLTLLIVKDSKNTHALNTTCFRFPRSVRMRKQRMPEITSAASNMDHIAESRHRMRHGAIRLGEEDCLQESVDRDMPSMKRLFANRFAGMLKMQSITTHTHQHKQTITTMPHC